jgi:transcriptional regulator with XRE-family HTH domain
VSFETFGERLKRTRIERKMTMDELGALVKQSRTVIRCWETENRMPGYWNFLQIAQALNLSLDYLAGFTDEPRQLYEPSGPVCEAPQQANLQTCAELPHPDTWRNHLYSQED